ncbi:MAG: CoA pyrophosphatase [Bdellovibrionales bacterium]|nr:CoA pyrophosphatase [Bdellovibrionales bacterium]
MKSFRENLEKAAVLDHPYSLPRPAQSNGVAASVLMVWASSVSSPHDPQVLVTRRTESVDTHKGQMAFPGGRQDPEDPSSVATALREAQEEVGLAPELVDVVATLPEMWTVTGFLVTPVLAVLKKPLDQVPLVYQVSEIDEALWVPYSRLVQTYRRETLARGSVRYPIDVFLDEPHRIWGVTGSLLKNLLERIERLG